jgi:hypothetical protein
LTAWDRRLAPADRRLSPRWLVVECDPPVLRLPAISHLEVLAILATPKPTPSPINEWM